MSVFGLIALAAVVHDDLTCITVGVFISNGTLSFWPSLFACFLGTYLGDLAWVLSGRYLGQPALRRIPLRWIFKADRMEQATSWFSHYGMPSLFFSRFLPGVRTPIQVASGLLSRDLRGVSLVLGFSGVVYTSLVLQACILAGRNFDVKALYNSYGQLALLSAAALLWIFLWLARLVLPKLLPRAR